MKPKTFNRALRCVSSQDSQDSQNYYAFRHLPSRYNSADLIACRIGGDSLADAGIPFGSMVAIAKGAPVRSGDLVAVRIGNDVGSTIRFVYFGPDGWIRLQSADRAEWPDQIYARGEFTIIGPVVRVELPEPQLTAA